MGVLRIDGARVAYLEAPRRAPQDVIAFLVQQLSARAQIVAPRDSYELEVAVHYPPR